MDNKKQKSRQNRALLTGTLTYGIGSFGTKVLNFLIVPLYTYYILPADLGDYDLLTTTVSLFSPLLTMKISDATYRWIIKNRENEIPYISATYKLLIRNCAFAAIILLLINHFIPIWNCYYFIAILIGDRCVECLQKTLRGLKNQKLFAISGIVHSAIFLTLAVVKVCALKEGATGLLQSSVISLYSTIFFLLISDRRLRQVDFKQNYKNQQREMLKYSMPLVPSNLSWWVMSASDRYVIRWILGSAANGIYSVAYKFPSVLQMIFTMFNNSWTDLAVSQLDKGDKSRDYTKATFKELYKVSFGLVFALIPFTKLFMKLILSESYKTAAEYVGFLYLGMVFQGLSTFCSVGYLQGKKTSGAAKTSIYGAVVNLLFNIIFIKYIGIYAAAISTFLGYFTMWLFRMHDIKNIFPIKVEYRHFIPYLATGIAIAIATIWTSNLVDFIISIVAVVFFFADNKNSLKHVISSFNLKKSH